MLELRPTCEHCNKALPFDANNAVICSFECTFCSECAALHLQHVCPNCGGDLVARPKRPSSKLGQWPVSDAVVHRPVDVEAHRKRLSDLLSQKPMP